MLETTAQWAKPILDLPIIRRTRRNHGLEHATITVLSSRVKDLRMAGRSNGRGFVLLGDAETNQVEAAAREALRRMRAGEHNLAVHPNCGTNLVTTAFLATLVSMLGFAGATRRGDWWNRMPAVMTMIIGSIIVGQPLGMTLQKHFTTDGDPADLEIVEIKRSQFRLLPGSAPVTMHRVVTRSS